MKMTTVLIASMALIVLVQGVSALAGLCAKCKDKMYTADVGRCSECGKGTASGAFKLCKDCSAKLKQCEHCRASLAGAAATQTRPAPEKPLVLTKADNNKTVSAQVGQTLVIRLKGNPTTGYLWQLTGKTGGALEQVGQIRYVQDKAPKGMVGVGGTYEATFRAVKAGEATVSLACARPWEKDKPPAETFKATVQVKASPTPSTQPASRPSSAPSRPAKDPKAGK